MGGKSLARSRPALAPKRHDPSSIRTFALDLDAGGLVPPQPAGWDNLVTVRSGSVRVHTNDATAVVTFANGVWIPDGVAYELALTSRAQLRIVYRAPDVPLRAHAEVAMNALMHELIERATVRGYLEPADPRDARLLAVMRDELAHLAPVARPAMLPLPSDAMLRAAIARYARALESFPSVAALAASAHVSVRTFERRFTAETGLTPRAWLARARLIAAVSMLASGVSVTEAGFSCGYGSTSAFVTAYRRMFGVTPGASIRRSRRPIGSRVDFC